MVIHNLSEYRSSVGHQLGATLNSSDGGGTSSGMEARVAKLEADAAHTLETLRDMKGDLRELRTDLKSDFRILFGSLITVALGLAGLMAKGFGWM